MIDDEYLHFGIIMNVIIPLETNIDIVYFMSY